MIEFAEPLEWAMNQAVQVFIRPADLTPVADGVAKTQGHVVSREFMGESTRYRVRLTTGREVSATVRDYLPFRVGDEVKLDVAAHRPIVFPA